MSQERHEGLQSDEGAFAQVVQGHHPGGGILVLLTHCQLHEEGAFPFLSHASHSTWTWAPGTPHIYTVLMWALGPYEKSC